MKLETANNVERPGESSRPWTGFSKFLKRALKEEWRAYRKEFKRCGRKFSQKSVHELRISIRRLLSTLGVLAGVIPDQDTTGIQKILKKRLKAFAKLRDTHAQLACVEEMRDRFSAAAQYRKALCRRERRLIKRVRRKLPDVQPGRVGRCVAALRKRLRRRAGDSALERKQFVAVQHALRAAYANVVERHRAIVPQDTGSIHRTRVAFKTFRYMMELLQPRLPGVEARQLEAMHDYQTRMGDIQDFVVLIESVEQFVKKHECKGRDWKLFRAGLVRLRAARIQRFMKTRDKLFEFYSFRPSPIDSPRSSRRKTQPWTFISSDTASP